VKAVQRFFSFHFSEKSFVLKASIFLIFIRCAFLILPFSAVRKLLQILTPKSQHLPQGPKQRTKENIAWVVEVASRRIRFTDNCLVKALVTHALLKEEGYPSSLHIGVAKKETSLFQAHAWIESEGQIVIGAPEDDASNFIPLPNLDGILS